MTIQDPVKKGGSLLTRRGKKGGNRVEKLHSRNAEQRNLIPEKKKKSRVDSESTASTD